MQPEQQLPLEMSNQTKPPSGTLSILDEKTFKHSIFRRGTKEELFREDDGEGDDGSIPADVSGDEKLPQLHQLWSLPRAGRDLSAAIWRPNKCAAEMVIQKGKLFAHVGSLWAGKTLLAIEEVVYMVDRGSLLLFREQGKKKVLMSMKDCYTLMASCGITMDHAACIGKLMRAGYVTHRFGVPWSVKDKREANGMTMDFTGMTNRLESAVAEGPASNDGRAVVKRKMEAEQTDAKRGRRSNGRDGRGDQGGQTNSNGALSAAPSSSSWWPAHEAVATSPAPLPCVVEPNREEKKDTLRKQFPHLRPLRTRSQADYVERHHGQKHAFFYLDVFPPNGNFSRKNTGKKAALVSMICNGSTVPPPESLLRDIDAEARAVSVDAEVPPTRFCGLEHGDIAFYSLVRTDVRDIH